MRTVFSTVRRRSRCRQRADMNRPARIAAVTTGLMGAGAVCGAVTGIWSLGLVMSISGPLAIDVLLVFGGMVGAVLGAIAAPILGWSLLRRVPFGRMLAVCSAGTPIGGAVGSFTTPQPLNFCASGSLGAANRSLVAASNPASRARLLVSRA